MTKNAAIHVHTRHGDKGRVMAAAGRLSLSDYLLTAINAVHGLHLSLHGGQHSERVKDGGYIVMYVSPADLDALKAAAGARNMSPWVKEAVNQYAGRELFDGVHVGFPKK